MAFAGTFVTLAASVLLGRWWESMLRGGGFAAEFRELRMGRVLAVALAAVLGVYLLTHAVVLESVICVLVAGFVLQGLAVLHTAAAAQGTHVGWLVALYVALFATALLCGDRDRDRARRLVRYVVRPAGTSPATPAGALDWNGDFGCAAAAALHEQR